MAKSELSTSYLEELFGTSSQIEPSRLKDYAVDGIEPKILLEPKTEEDASKIIAAAYRENLSIAIRGSGTKMTLGAQPRAIDTMIATRHLNKVVEYESADLTISVQSGILLSDLQKILASKGQFLPIDPPHYEQATLGGIVATNANGPKRLLFGSMRDLLLGVRVIESEGTIIKAGGKVVKNVSGYDMRKLFIGSLGTLGLITRVSLKVLPIPEKEAAVIGHFSNVEDAEKTVSGLLTSEFVPQTIAAVGIQSDGMLGARKVADDVCVLFASFCGLHEDVEAQKRRVHNLYQKNAAKSISFAEGNEHEKLLAEVREFPAMAGPVICKASVPISNTMDMVKTTKNIGTKLNLSCDYIAHPGTGILYIKLGKLESHTTIVEDYVKAITALRYEASKFQGSLVVEKAPVAVKERIDVWGVTGATVQLMKAIKARFDPKSLFNPGRFVGGI